MTFCAQSIYRILFTTKKPDICIISKHQKDKDELINKNLTIEKEFLHARS